MKKHFFLSVLVLLSVAGAGVCSDVLRFRGENSQGAYAESNLLKKWPDGGLSPKWVYNDLGAGWSSVAKVDERLYVNGMDPSDAKQEAIICLDLNGKKIWQTTTGSTWTKSYAAARSTPTFVRAKNGLPDLLVVMTGNGEVCCLQAKDGKLLWKKDVASTYAGKPGHWGYSESLVTKDGKVFATPCGGKASVVAMNLADGKVIWEAASTGDKCAYVTPALYGNQLIQLTSTYLFAVDTESGKIKWKSNYADISSARWKGIYCIPPLLKGNKVFVTSGYDQGSAMYEIAADGNSAKLLWKNLDLDPHHGGVVEMGGRIYGSNWINNGTGNWMCVDWNTGKTIYETTWDKLGKGSIISADGMLYIYEERKGTLGLLKPADSFEVVSQFQINFGSKEHWAHPVISDGVLYIRHGNALAAFDISKK